MKIRTGFVSNSSSSSFLIHIKEIFPENPEDERKRYLTTDQEEFLLDNNFDYTDATSPEQIEFYRSGLSNRGYEGWKADKKTDKLGYSVDVNEDMVIRFLVKNRIQFQAVIHYGHEVVLYRPDWDYIMWVINAGAAYATYNFPEVCGCDDKFRLANEKTFRIKSVDTYLRETAWLEDEYYPFKESNGEDS